MAVYAPIIVICSILMPFLPPSGRIFPVLSGLAVGLLVPLSDAAWGNRDHLRFAWFSIRYRRHTIRISLSYLFRIKIDDKYLLIRSRRAPIHLPVGGVYKYTASAKSELDGLGMLSDHLVPIDAASENDLRVRVPGRNLAKFMRWFDGGTSRETAPWREFHEELVAPGILDAAVFPWVLQEHLRRCSTPIRWSTHAQSLEMIVADVYELLPSAGQTLQLRQLMTNGHPDIQWLREEQIRRGGAMPGSPQMLQVASPVSQWII